MSEKPTHTQEVKSNIDIIHFEMDDAGNHRLVCGNHKGDWAIYQGISTIILGGDWYIGVTQYFDGVLPTEKALLLKQGVTSQMRLVDGIRPE